MSEIWYSSSTFQRAFSWYPWCQNRPTGTEKKIFEPDHWSSLVYTIDARSHATDAKKKF